MSARGFFSVTKAVAWRSIHNTLVSPSILPTYLPSDLATTARPDCVSIAWAT